MPGSHAEKWTSYITSVACPSHGGRWSLRPRMYRASNHGLEGGSIRDCLRRLEPIRRAQRDLPANSFQLRSLRPLVKTRAFGMTPRMRGGEFRLWHASASASLRVGGADECVRPY